MPSGLKYYFTLIILLSITFVSNAQYSSKNSFWNGFSVSGMLGLNMFYGDLVSTSRTNFSGGFIAEKELNTYLLGRFQLMGGKMQGQQINDWSDPDNEILSASFTNKYIDAAVGLSFRPLDLFMGYFQQRPFNPYIFFQGGMIYYDATETFHEGYPIPDADYRVKSSISPLIQFGPGLSYWINPRLSVRAEFNGTYVFGDLVDAHKEWESPDGTIHPTKGNDYYYTITAGITYLINSSAWKNDPKYNRKAYLSTRSALRKSSSRKRYKSKKKYKPRSYKKMRKRRRR
jgi:hypothetical protein